MAEISEILFGESGRRKGALVCTGAVVFVVTTIGHCIEIGLVSIGLPIENSLLLGAAMCTGLPLWAIDTFFGGVKQQEFWLFLGLVLVGLASCVERLYIWPQSMYLSMFLLPGLYTLYRYFLFKGKFASTI